MSYRIKKVVVLGSGVMGSGIACHLANVGMEVLMLDIVPSDQSDSKDQKTRNSIADSALLKAIKSKPSPVYEKKNADKISTGNFTDNFKDISVVNGAFKEAESYSVFTSTNGECAVFGSNRAEKRAGWTRFTTQGSFESVVAIDDRLFASVWFDNVNLRLCEFITDHHLDNSKVYSVSNKSVSTGSDFTNGTVVHVIGKTASGREDYLGTHTIANTAISLAEYNETYATAEIGYKFTVNVTTNPIDVQLPIGPVTGTPRGIATVVCDLLETRSISLNNIPLTTDSSFTGKKEFRLLGYSRDPQVVMTQNEPLSFQVNGITAELII